MELTNPQYLALCELPKSFWPEYKPIVKLVELGFATKTEKRLGNPTYSITESGKAQLAIENARRTKTTP